MNPSHVAGGGIGAILGAVIVGLLKHFGIATVTDIDAAVIGSAALSAGVGLGHAISEYGLSGMATIVWHGHKQPEPVKQVTVIAPVQTLDPPT